MTGAELVYEFQPLTPAGTAQNAPNTVAMTIPSLEVQFIEWKVPPGPQGNLGWQLWYSGALVIPQNGTWVVTDNESGKWEIDELPTTGAWQFKGYNTGTYDHTVYLRFLLLPLQSLQQLGGDYTVQTIYG
jgi:hypothetical protein